VNRRLPPSRKYEEEDFMKKLVAISVLFAGLATAVFAQDGGWSNAWKLGFTMKFPTDLFYTAHMSGKSEKTQETTPGVGDDAGALYAGDGTKTTSTEYGKYSKGVTNFFPNGDIIGAGGDERIYVTLTNSGENYDISVNVGLDKWATRDADGFKWKNTGPFKFLMGNMTEDWGVKLRAGIFDFGIGAWASDSISWIGYYGIWGSWINMSAEFSRFGVWRTGKDPGWSHSDHFRTLYAWGDPVYVGIGLGDNFKFTLGYTLDWDKFTAITNKNDNRSGINGTFMFSGRPVDALTFELFYAIRGQDKDTFSRPGTPSDRDFGYHNPDGSWRNIIGAYFDVKGIENLAIRGGYTVNFNAYDVGGFLCSDGDFTQTKPVTYNAPIYSGIDLRLGYTGIDKIGLKFYNNVTFAGVNGDKVAKDTSDTKDLHDRVYKDKINLLFNEDFVKARTDGEGLTQNWFHWTSLLSASLGFIDGVNIEVSVADNLGVLTEKTDKTVPDDANTYTTKSQINRTTTTNEFRATVGAKYGMGGATLGVALYFSIKSDLIDDATTTTTTQLAGGAPRIVKTTEKSNNDTVTFGIPITFTLSF